LEVRWAFREHDLARRPNVGLEKVAAVRSAVFLADHGMSVDGRLAVLQGDVADERQELDLEHTGKASG
jgi:hypothetical protein